jgi:hypothetical protein
LAQEPALGDPAATRARVFPVAHSLEARCLLLRATAPPRGGEAAIAQISAVIKSSQALVMTTAHAAVAKAPATSSQTTTDPPAGLASALIRALIAARVSVMIRALAVVQGLAVARARTPVAHRQAAHLAAGRHLMCLPTD